MNANVRKNLISLLICVVIIFVSAGLAHGVESDFGKVSVTHINFSTGDGLVMAGKVYRPIEATAKNPLPAVLGLHGYQNDKETAGDLAVELARRGFVVFTPDVYGHGESQGYVDWATMSGVQYTYDYMKTLPFVDVKNLGVFGHSMGAMETIALGAVNPDIKALNPQCGPDGTPEMKNLLLTQAKFEEFRGFRENQINTTNLPANPDRIKAFGLTDAVAYNTSFTNSAGNLRRVDLVSSVHPGVTFNAAAVAGSIDWFTQVLKPGQAPTIPSNQQVFMWKELFMLIALLTTMASTIFLLNLLLASAWFAPIATAMPSKYYVTGWKWWGPALISIAIAAVTYPLLTSLSRIGGNIYQWMPFFKMEMTSGIAVWWLGVGIISAIMLFFWYRSNSKKNGITMHDLGLSFDETKTNLRWDLIGKTALVAGIFLAWMYTLVAISQWLFGIEFRFIWSFMRVFPSPIRFFYFWVYLIPALAFFLTAGGIAMFGQLRQKEYSTPAQTQIIWWLKNCVLGVGGLIIVWLVQYVPYFMGKGPGFELMGMPQFTEMWPLMLFIIVPEFMIILYFMTHYYRKTGKIYLTVMMAASWAVWFSVAGTVLSK